MSSGTRRRTEDMRQRIAEHVREYAAAHRRARVVANWPIATSPLRHRSDRAAATTAVDAAATTTVDASTITTITHNTAPTSPFPYACAHTKSFDRRLCVFRARRRVVTFDEKALSAASKT